MNKKKKVRLNVEITEYERITLKRQALEQKCSLTELVRRKLGLKQRKNKLKIHYPGIRLPSERKENSK